MSEQDPAEGEPAEPEEPKIILTQADITAGLSNLYRVPSKFISYHFDFLDGATYAYATLTAEEKDPQIQNLVDVNKGENEGKCYLDSYQYLRVLKIGSNAFTSIDEVKNLPYLLELQAKNNQITNIDFLADAEKLKFIQKVDLTTNKVTKIPHIVTPNLFKLVLDENEIATSELKTHQALKILSLNKNKMTNCNGISRLFSLVDLSIQENEIATLEGLINLPKLKKLQLNGNKLEKLDHMPVLESIQELILDGNQIASLAEISKLSGLKSLEHLSMGGNPIADEKGDDFKKEVLILLYEHLPNLKKINGEPFTKEDIEEAMTLKEERRKEAEAAAAEAANKPEGEGEEAPAEDE